MVKNPPAMRETRVRSLCREDPLEKGMATHSGILAGRIPMDRGAWWATVHGVTQLDMTEWLTLNIFKEETLITSVWDRNKIKMLPILCSNYVCLWRGLPRCAGGKELTLQCRRLKRHWFNPWVRKSPWRRAWQPILVLLPGQSHGQRSLEDYSLYGGKELNTTEAT